MSIRVSLATLCIYDHSEYETTKAKAEVSSRLSYAVFDGDNVPDMIKSGPVGTVVYHATGMRTGTAWHSSALLCPSVVSFRISAARLTMHGGYRAFGRW